MSQSSTMLEPLKRKRCPAAIALPALDPGMHRGQGAFLDRPLDLERGLRKLGGFFHAGPQRFGVAAEIEVVVAKAGTYEALVGLAHLACRRETEKGLRDVLAGARFVHR
jgi:hypothetical protein